MAPGIEALRKKRFWKNDREIPDFVGMTISQLVELFEKIGLEQDRALDYAQYDLYNQLYDDMLLVEQELTARGEQARLALVRLFGRRSRQVRQNAAIAARAVAPVAARQLLETIRTGKWYPRAIDAGMILNGLDNGTFKPV